MKNKFDYLQKGNQIVAMLTIMIFFFTSAVFAQQQTLKGKVSSSSGESLIGATVSVVGTTRGASTDSEGNYKIEAKSGDNLRFSSVGYGTKNIVYTGQATLNVTLESDDKTLNEWGYCCGKGYDKEIIEKFKLAVHTLRKAAIMAQRVDWLVSGDDGEDSFHRRWDEELNVTEK